MMRLGYRIDDVFYGTGSYLEELPAKLAKLTLTDVQKAVSAHIHPKSLYVVFVGPDAKQLADTIVAGKATAITYDTAGTAPQILSDDKQISVLPWDIKRDDIEIISVDNIFEK